MTVRAFVVGGAGFIGSHLVDLLTERGPVTVFDDLSVGKRELIGAHLDGGAATLVVGDARDLGALTAAMAGHDVVFHLSANPEARWGLASPRLDLEQGTIATWNALEAARTTGVRRFVFSSSGTVYGNEPSPKAEGDLGALPISLYGASKLAGEAMVSAYVECFGLQAVILRFGNVVGSRGTHGAILDFAKKLRATPDRLEVLGDGRQAKPYLHVTDCARGILHALDAARAPLEVFNLAPAGTTSVRTIAELCVAASPNPKACIELTGGSQGWKGDVPVSQLDMARLAATGFRLRYGSDEAVARAVSEVMREVFGP